MCGASKTKDIHQENRNMLFSFYLACIYGFLIFISRERERMREGISELLWKYTSCFVSTSSNSIILLVSAHLQWHVFEDYLKWIAHWSDNLQRYKMLLFSVLLSSFCTFRRCTCIEIIGLPSSQTAFKYGLGSYLIQTEATARAVIIRASDMGLYVVERLYFFLPLLLPDMHC